MPTEKFMRELMEIFGSEYERLYESYSETGFYVDLFDSMCAQNSKFVDLVYRFNEMRNDYLSSDREFAAFWIAYCRMTEKQRLFPVYGDNNELKGYVADWPEEYVAQEDDEMKKNYFYYVVYFEDDGLKYAKPVRIEESRNLFD